MSRIRGNCFETMSFLELMLLLLENAAPVSLCLNARPKMVQGSARPLHPLCCIFSFFVRYCSEDSFGDFIHKWKVINSQSSSECKKCAAGGNNPLVLKLSARIITASKRHLSLPPPLLGPTGLLSSSYLFYAITTKCIVCIDSCFAGLRIFHLRS